MKIFYAYYGNTAVDLGPLPVSRARLPMMEPVLSETCLKWQRRSKVPSNSRCVPSYDFSTQKRTSSGNSQKKLLLFIVTQRFHLFLHLKKHLAGKKFDNDDEVQEEVMTWFKG